MKTNKKMSRLSKNDSAILSYLDKTNKDLGVNLHKLFEQVKAGDEFELIFFGRKGSYLQQEKYIKLLKYLAKNAEMNNLQFIEPSDVLDINYSVDKDTSMRCTIDGRININKIMKKLNIPKNHVVFKTLVDLHFNSDKNNKLAGVSFMKKEKENSQVVEVDDFDFRARLSHETSLSEKDIEHCSNIDVTFAKKINFRHKQRASLFIVGNEQSDEFIRVDLTITKNTDQFKKLNKVVPNYELEIEYGTKSKVSVDLLDTMLIEADKLLKVVNQSNHIMPKSKLIEVYMYYRKLLFITENTTGLDARQPITLEIQHVTEVLPNRYAVTDKADGDRQFLIVFDKRVYLISTNMDIKYTGIELANDEYNGSLLDGELIFISHKNRHVYLAFDCLFHKSQDVRKTIKLFDRLKYADDIIANCFVFGKQKGFTENAIPNTKQFNLDTRLNFHFEEIKRSVTNLNHDIDLEKQFPLIRRKYFIGAEGAKEWEIFSYACLLYNAFTTNADIKCPYFLDGLIFQPLDQAYVTNINESRYSDFKWKPPEKNSIDFYVEFEKDKDGKILTAYDNSHEEDEEFSKNKSYKICKLFVGQRTKGTEVPILFKEDEELYYAYIFVENGEARDIEGNIISDKTVVEFYYNNNQEVMDKFRWVALRTRYDKTESVMRFGKKYGNAAMVANKIWRSILNPVLMSDMEDLSQGNNTEKNIYAYDKKIAQLKSKITHELIMTATSENKYFQKITALAKPMRGFTNWIKSNMIYTYCHPMYQENKQLSVLDIGCGKGQDIMKFYYSMASILVAIDVDRAGLVSGTDGAVSRYNLLRTKKPNFPKMYFIQADATAEFDIELQHKALNVKKLENEDFFKKFFSKDSRMLFDRINCQLAVHYMLRNADCWTNFKNNLNNHLRNGGYFLASTFDAEKVMKLIGTQEKASHHYVDEDGKSHLLFEIVKKYITPEKNAILGTGNPIDVYISWFSEEGRYLTEYLVDSRFFVEELKKDCGLELIDSDNFGNQLNMHEEYLTKYAKYEETNETRKFLADVAKFYENNSVNDGCKIWNSLFRYYVFRKVDNPKLKQKGGDESLNFNDVEKFIVPSMNKYKDKEYSFANGIHHVLKNHQIIPHSLSPQNLFQELGLNMPHDDTITQPSIKSFVKNINIEHVIDETKQTTQLINGLNVFIVERDCNDNYDVELIQKSKKMKEDDLALIMMKEGTWYVPVYTIDQNTHDRVGLYSMKNPIISQLMNEL